MKKRRIFSTALAALLALPICFFAACGEKENKKKTSGVLQTIELPDVVSEVGELVEYESFMKQAETGESNLEGIVVSPFYDLEVNGKKVYSYCTPTVTGEVHSFGYIDATEDSFPMTVKIRANYALTHACVIPEKLGVETELEGNEVTFKIDGFESYNVLFNGKFNFDRPYTLHGREYEELEVPKGYKLIEFKPGVHFVDYIKPESNTLIYLHAGALVVGKQPDVYTEKNVVNQFGNRVWQAFIGASGKENIMIKGHGMIDLSNLTLHARTPISFTSCKNVSVEGITLVNSMSWTLHCTDCVGVHAKDLIFMGYRINSDGIAMCNVKDALIENCWLRTGDDMFEVKATKSDTSLSGTGGENITFRHNQAFAEKTRSFGFIQESQADVSNILFEDCSSLMQVAEWNAAMGAFLVIVGDTSTVKNVVFRNCDSYYAIGYVLNVAVGPNQWSLGETVGAIHDVTFENFRYYSKGENPDGTEWVSEGLQIRNQGYDGYEHVAGTEENLYNITYRNVYRDGVKLTQADLADKSVFSIFGKHGKITIE